MMRVFKEIRLFLSIQAFYFIFIGGLIYLSNVDASDTYYQGSSGVIEEAGECSTPSTGSLFNEGFEGTGYDSGKSVAETGTVNEDASRPGTQSPTGLCGQSLYVDGSGVAYSSINEGTARDEVYIRFYFYVDSSTPSTVMSIFVANELTSIFNRTATVNLSTFGLGVNAEGATASSYINISADTWHRIDLHVVRNDTSWISVDGGTQQTFTANDYPVQYYKAGACINQQSGDYYFDIISVDTSPM